MKNKILFSALACVLVFSCKKDPVTPNSIDYFIFGVGYCECVGMCGEFYKYTTDALVKGDGGACVPEGHTYNGSALSDDDFAVAEALLISLPDDLYYAETTTFGCPDCHDQGAYYVEIKKEGVVKSWVLDPDADAIPAFLVPFRQRLKDALDTLD